MFFLQLRGQIGLGTEKEKSDMSDVLSRDIKIPVFIGLACAVLLIYQATSANAESKSEGQAIKSEQIRFEQIAPFVQMGGAWGDRSRAAHGTFGRFPAGAASPAHTHSGAYHAVVISGVMTNPFEGEKNPPHMGPGSYWYVPGGMDHVTACVSAEPCLFYFHADRPFDFTPTEQ